MGIRLTLWLRKKEWLVIILALIVVLRIPSLFEPYWYGDEAIYLTLGQAINKGVPLYSGIHDNKPPLLYVMAAVAGGNQFWFKFLAMGWNLITVCVFVKLAEKIFENRRKQVIISTVIFGLLTTIPLWEGNIVNAELFFLLPTILAINLLWKKQSKLIHVVLAGFVLGVGALFKMPAILEAGVWPLIWLATGEKEAKRKIALFTGAILFPIIVSGVFFSMNGSFFDYLNAAWLQNFPYLSSWQSSNASEGVFSLKGRAILAIIAIAVFWGLARKIGRMATVVGIWGIIGLFASTLSGRPYPHYLMQMAGVTAISIAMLWERKRVEIFVGAGILVMILMSYAAFRFYVYPITGYYSNFISWMWGTKDTKSYYSWFNQNVNINYEVASVVKSGSKSGDQIFVWGDEPSIYALTQRLPVGKFTAKYHIKDFRAEELVMAQLTKNPPKYIIDYGKETELPGLSELLAKQYFLEKTVSTVKIYKWTRLPLVLSKL